MRVEITLKDDKGEILHEYEGDALTPYSFRTLPDRPFVQEELRSVSYLFGLTLQPTVTRKIR